MKYLSIKMKFLVLFGAVAFVTIALSLAAFWGQSETVNSYRRLITEELGARDQIRRIERLLTEMRLYERDFFLTKKLAALDQHDRVSEEFRKTLAGIEISGKKEILDSFENYHLEFSLAVEAATQISDPTKGLENKLKTNRQNIKKLIDENNLPDIYQVYLLTMQTHEKNYLLSGDQQYINQMSSSLKEVLSVINKSNRPNELKVRLADEFNNYSNNFRMLASKYVLMAESDVAMLKEIKERTEPLINRTVEAIEYVVEDEQDSLVIKVKKMGMMFAGATLIVFFVLAIALLVVWKLSGSLAMLVEQLRVLGERNGEGSKSIQNASERVSSAVTEQASAIQETVSTLDEISAMVERSVKNAELSFEASVQSEEDAKAGARGMDEVTSAVNRIQENSNTVLDRVEDGHNEMGKILEVIQQIAEKTKVINDIVFQTKLLSFNASVEAARAGEHGKGFSVVAEEVGNLATMSGNAAGEIEGMLGDSITQVELILDKTKTAVKQALEQGTVEVNEGVQVAQRGREIMERVQSSVVKVKSALDEIRRASQEQAEGVRNITTAMGQLDQVTNENAEMAQQSSSKAGELEQSACELESRLQDLESLVFGDKKAPGAKIFTFGKREPEEITGPN